MPARMNAMRSRAMGKMKTVKAKPSGLVGVFKTLAKQHSEIMALLERAKMSDQDFAELWPTIRQDLVSHEKAEVSEVFPVLRSYNAMRAITIRHDLEANELERLVACVDKLPTASPKRRESFQQLIDLFLIHVREEDRSWFPKAQKVIGKPEAGVLNTKFLAAQQRIAKAI